MLNSKFTTPLAFLFLFNLKSTNNYLYYPDTLFGKSSHRQENGRRLPVQLSLSVPSPFECTYIYFIPVCIFPNILIWKYSIYKYTYRYIHKCVCVYLFLTKLHYLFLMGSNTQEFCITFLATYRHAM